MPRIVSQFAFLILLVLMSSLTPVQAQYAIPDCFVARVNSTFPQEEYWASRDAWYRELSGEWNSMVAGLSAEQITAYTAVFCNTLVVIDGGDSEDGQSRIVEWSYMPADTWLAQTGGRVAPPAPSDNSGSAVTSTGNATSNTVTASNSAAQTASTTEDIFSTEFDTLPDELMITDSNGNPLSGQLTPGNGDSALRIKTSDYAVVYLDEPSLTDYALEVRARINSGELMLTVRAGQDMCSGYDFGYAPSDDFAYLRVTDDECNTTLVEEAYGLGYTLGDEVTLRLEIDDSRLTAYAGGEEFMSATVRAFSEGFPALYLFSETEPAQDALIDIAAMRVLPAGTAEAAGGTLTQYAGSHGTAIAELQALGIIPNTRGTFIFQEPTAYFEGDGSWYTPLASANPHTNIVMGGNLEVTFNAPSEYEACKLMTRIVTRGNSAVQELSAGIDSDGDVFLIDADDPDASQYSTFEYDALNGSLDDSHHFMIVAMGNLVSVYVDGELFFDRVKVDQRGGTYGIGLASHDGDSRCEANNLWVYSFD